MYPNVLFYPCLGRSNKRKCYDSSNVFSFDVDNGSSQGRFPLDTSASGLVLQNIQPGRRESFLYRWVRSGHHHSQSSLQVGFWIWNITKIHFKTFLCCQQYQRVSKNVNVLLRVVFSLKSFSEGCTPRIIYNVSLRVVF